MHACNMLNTFCISVECDRHNLSVNLTLSRSKRGRETQWKYTYEVNRTFASLLRLFFLGMAQGT